ncbi:helix-turn-helix domain-containing protein [Castellaniella sp.]|uniref:helix-turn-helix domain-containing protein n=1 Tax=Castellaniella sp. TaxID=1955812 RepID=UPI003C740E02
MDIRPIRTETDYKASLKTISRLMESDPDLGTPEGDRLDVLTTLVQAYEAKHFQIDLPDPVEAIKFRMEQAGLTAKDLEPMIGQRNRVYEILNRKRPLTLPMIRRLHKGLGIPAENLIQPTEHA